MSTAYHSQYWAHALTLRGSGGDIAALSRSIANARVDLNPHQIDAALFALRSPFTNGAILADEVGLGKTVEAGIGRNAKGDALLPFDLPWNPQRIEQRIGRCHRYGQKHDVVVVNFLNRRNEADKRVYELLSEKFRLFDGVFGASDEVLGALESGVDIERRIAEVYQTCRTNADIQAAFDALQAELDAKIQARLAATRQALMENFDEDVRSRLKISVIEPLVGQSGWMEVSKLTVAAVEVDEFLVFAASTDHKQALDDEICRKLLSLPARVVDELTADNADERRSDSEHLRKSALSAVQNEDVFDNRLIFGDNGLGYLGYTKLRSWNAHRKAQAKARQVLVETGITQRRQYLETHLFQETIGVIPSDFYTYDGFRDWWRMTLVFPYQLMCIDTRDRAYLEKYNPKYPVADPNQSTTGVFGDITHIATDNAILLYERKTDTGLSYGILQYESGRNSEFKSVEQFWAAAQKAGYSGPETLISIDDMFTAYYNYEKEFVEQSPGGDSLKAAPQE